MPSIRTRRAGRALDFPRDHGSHPEFRTEWWYVTGWVADAAGNAYGVQVTFFRNRPRVAEANPSAFAPRQLVFAHAALADPRRGRLLHDQRAAREGFGLAGADEATTRVWIDDWSLALVDGAYAARIVAREFTLDLRFAPTQPILLPGRSGVFAQGTRAGAGELLLQSAAARGQREHRRRRSAQSPSPAARGSITNGRANIWRRRRRAGTGRDCDLADGGAMMVFRIRDKSGGALWAGGTVRGATGACAR